MLIYLIYHLNQNYQPIMEINNIFQLMITFEEDDEHQIQRVYKHLDEL
jgi:hypothetical protein